VAKAKFGQPYDPEILFNDRMSSILEFIGMDCSEGGDFPDSWAIVDIADAIFRNSESIGWWKMNAEERQKYTREIVLRPHFAKDSAIEEIILAVDDMLYSYARIVQISNSS